MADFGLTAAGFVAPRASDFLPLIQDDILAALAARGLSTDVDFERDIVWGITSTVMATRLGQLGQLLQSVYDAKDINNATGLLLDSIGGLRGIPRLGAEYTRVDLELGNTTALPALLEGGQAIAEGGGTDDRQKWVLVDDVTIPASGTVTAEFRSDVEGEFEASVGVIDTIVTAVDGWTSVTNPAVPSPGRYIESDNDYRLRLQQNLVPSLGQNGQALRATLVALEGVDSAGVIENETGSVATVEGVSLQPHSKAVFVWPDTLTAAQIEAVAQAIYDQTDFGIYTNGTNNVVEITGLDGFAKEIRFDWASEVTINWSVTLTLDIGFVLSDVQTQVEANVSAYFAGLAVGEDVRWLKILSAISNTTGVLNAALLLNGSPSDVSVLASEIGTEGTATVTT